KSTNYTPSPTTLSKQHDQPWSSASETAIRSCEKPPNEVESHTTDNPGLRLLWTIQQLYPVQDERCRFQGEVWFGLTSFSEVGELGVRVHRAADHADADGP